jgi:hypothetical protein
MDSTAYIETFDTGPGGWIGWHEAGPQHSEVRDGVLYSRSPWWIDYNHAPPGAGYLHLLACLHTHRDAMTDAVVDVAWPNRYIEQKKSRNVTNAKVTVRVKGELDLNGAEVVLLVQADIPGTRANFVLVGQPIHVTPEWSEQTIELLPDPGQWICLGSRHNRTETYGSGNIADALRDLNVDIIFCLFPLTIVAEAEVDDPHSLRAGLDYEVDHRRLPSGVVMFDTVKIEYAA